MKRAVQTSLVLVLTLWSVLLAQTSAAAAPVRNGICDQGEVCFYYNSYEAGSLSDMSYSLTSYGVGSACNHFIGAGNGKGLCLEDNAASVWNRTGQRVTVFEYAGSAGNRQEIPANYAVNLNSLLKNKNSAHLISAPAYVPPDVAPVFRHWEDGAGGIHHHAAVTFRASDFHNGLHVKRVWVRLTRFDCKLYPDTETGQVFSAYASSPSDSVIREVQADIWDSPFPSCTIRSSWGVEYF